MKNKIIIVISSLVFILIGILIFIYRDSLFAGIGRHAPKSSKVILSDKEKGIEITAQDHKKLYIDDKVFEKRFGITKKIMLEKYNYEEYLEQKIKKE